MAEPLLTLTGVHAHYGTAHVLFGVDLDVPTGGVLAMLGRNGAGKSTTAKAIMGVDVRVTGRIMFAGRDIGKASTTERARRGLQLIPEDRRIYADLTVRENLQLGRHAAGDRAPLDVSEVVGTFPIIESLLDRRGDALSGGEQQIVAVGRAMVARPLLVIMDEPSEGLAPIIVEQVGAAIRSLRTLHGTTILLIEQNAVFALALADAVAILEEGAVTARGTPAEITSDPQLQRRLLSVSG